LKTNLLTPWVNLSKVEYMTENLISHGFFKHLPGAPCKVCEKRAIKEAVSNPDESETVDTNEQSGVPEVQAQSAENRQENAENVAVAHSARTYSESEVIELLQEAKNSTVNMIFTDLLALVDRKQAELAMPVLRRIELETLQRNYESPDSQSVSGE
jgi:hypothetical protein